MFFYNKSKFCELTIGNGSFVRWKQITYIRIKFKLILVHKHGNTIKNWTIIIYTWIYIQDIIRFADKENKEGLIFFSGPNKTVWQVGLEMDLFVFEYVRLWSKIPKTDRNPFNIFFLSCINERFSVTLLSNHHIHKTRMPYRVTTLRNTSRAKGL